jgi:stage V sporulation protein B
MYIDTATDALLKGLGQQVYSMNVNIIDALLSVILVFFLVPRFGIHGYVITIYITEIFNAACSIARLLHISHLRLRLVRLLLLPLISAIGAAALSNIFFHYIYIRSGSVALTTHISCFAVLYLALLIFTDTLPISDLKWLKNLFFCKQSGALAKK